MDEKIQTAAVAPASPRLADLVGNMSAVVSAIDRGVITRPAQALLMINVLTTRSSRKSGSADDGFDFMAQRMGMVAGAIERGSCRTVAQVHLAIRVLGGPAVRAAIAQRQSAWA